MLKFNIIVELKIESNNSNFSITQYLLKNKMFIKAENLHNLMKFWSKTLQRKILQTSYLKLHTILIYWDGNMQWI